MTKRDELVDLLLNDRRGDRWDEFITRALARTTAELTATGQGAEPGEHLQRLANAVRHAVTDAVTAPDPDM